MKKIFLLILLFISFQSFGQDIGDSSDSNLKNWAKIVNYDFEKNSSFEKTAEYKHFKRWEYWNDLVLNSKGEFDASKIEKAFLRYNQNKKSDREELGQWEQIGPVGLVSDYGTGRVNVVAFDPKDNDKLWLGAASGGLWKTTDGGKQWNPVTDDFRMMGISDIVVNPDSSDVIYVATGDRDAGAVLCYGLFKSLDDGNTWSKTSLPTSNKIHRVLINHQNGNELYVSTDTAVYKSIDSGKTWNSIFSGHQIREIEYKPGDFNTLYVIDTYIKEKFFVSRDGGVSFEAMLIDGISNSVKRIAIATTAINPEIVYLLAGKNKVGSNANDFVGLFKSVDSGQNFTKVNVKNNLNLGSQSWYDWVLAISPENENEIYAGGVDFYCSKDGGETWKISESQDFAKFHEDHHFVDIQSGTGVVFVGNDGGVYKSEDKGDSWISLNNSLSITQYYKISTAAKDYRLMIGGTQDNGSQLWKNEIWSKVLSKDGMDCAIDNTDSDIIYGSAQNGYFKKSSDRGNTFKHIISSVLTGENGAWVAPFVIDTKSPNVLYAGYQSLWRSEDNGNKWKKISKKLQGSSTIRGITIARSDSNIIYFNYKKNLYKSIDRGESFEEVILPVSGVIKDIEISPLNPEKVWLIIGSDVFLSENGGVDWENISSGLPEIPLTTIAVQNNNLESIYLGSYGGVFYKDTSLVEWVSFNKGLPQTRISDIEIREQFGTITVGTYGRGIWQSLLFDINDTKPGCVEYVFPELGDIFLSDSVNIKWVKNIVNSGYKIVIGSFDGGSDILDTAIYTNIDHFVWNRRGINDIVFINIIPFNKSGEAVSCSSLRIISGCAYPEKKYLIDIYKTLKETSLSKSIDWDTSSCDLSSWEGLEFNDSLEVISLNLWRKDRIGTMSESLGKLKKLKSLILGGNRIDFGGFECIYNLSNLEVLNLTDCIDTGKFPEKISELKKLKYLNLQSCYLGDSIPFDKLSNVEVLVLNRMNLKHINNIDKLKNCKELYLKWNRLTELPSSIGELEKAEIINLSFNKLTGSIPESIGNLKNCRSLNLYHNKLTGSIPDSFGKLKKIEYLNISENELNGTITDSIGNLINCKYLNLDNNLLKGNIPETLGNLKKCVSISLSNNNLSGSISASILNLSKCKDLNLSSNKLSGELPEIGDMSLCTIFDIGNNNLSGEIPESLGHLIRTQRINLSHNNFSGSIPSSVMNLKPEYLYLNDNELTAISDELLKMKATRYIDISNNRISGELPNIKENSSIFFLYMDHNHFSGNIPNSYGLKQTWFRLDLSDNDIEGCLPNSLIKHCGHINISNNPKLQNGVTLKDFCDNNIGNCNYVPRCVSGLIKENTSDTLPYNKPIKWIPNYEAKGYIVSVGTSLDSMDLAKDVDVGGSNEIDVGTMPVKTKIYVVISAYNDYGFSYSCDTLSFVANYPVNTIDISNKSDEFIAIYPNPAKDYLTIKRTDKRLGNGSINILNIAGSSIGKTSFNREVKEIDISELENGVYTIVITFDRTTVYKKLFVFR